MPHFNTDNIHPLLGIQDMLEEEEEPLLDEELLELLQLLSGRRGGLRIPGFPGGPPGVPPVGPTPPPPGGPGPGGPTQLLGGGRRAEITPGVDLGMGQPALDPDTRMALAIQNSITTQAQQQSPIDIISGQALPMPQPASNSAQMPQPSQGLGIGQPEPQQPGLGIPLEELQAMHRAGALRRNIAGGGSGRRPPVVRHRGRRGGRRSR